MSGAKAALALAALLLLAPRAFAQDAPNTGPRAFYDESNNFYNPANNLYPSTGVTETSYYGAVQPDEISAAVNDGAYVPSAFVDFDEAVALGNEQLTAQQQGLQRQMDFNSFAQKARTVASTPHPAHTSSALVQQDHSGALVICDTAGDRCQPLN